MDHTFQIEQIEDAVDNVGGWGEASQQQTRIKERRIVLCLDDKGTTYKPPSGRGGGGSSAASAGGSSAASEGKVKFRRLNNGAGEYACIFCLFVWVGATRITSTLVVGFPYLHSFLLLPLLFLADASLAASALASIKTDTSGSLTGSAAASATSAAKAGTAAIASTPAGEFR